MVARLSPLSLQVRDLFAEEDLGTFTEEIQVAVDLHDVRMLKLTPMTHRPEFENWRPWTASVPRYGLPVTIPVNPLPDEIGGDKAKPSSDPESLPDYAWGFIEQTLPTRFNPNGRFGRRAPTYSQAQVRACLTTWFPKWPRFKKIPVKSARVALQSFHGRAGPPWMDRLNS